MKFWGLITFWALMAAEPSLAQVQLGQLSNCEGLNAVVARMRDRERRCRLPRDAIEQRLSDFLSNNPQVKLCYLRTPPHAGLNGFGCMLVDLAGQSISLLCIRRSVGADLAAYWRDYDQQLAGPVNDYLDRASGCAIGNGDATVGPSTMMPMILSYIAKHAIAYVLPVGSDSVGSSAIVHGYAHLDPQLSGDPDPAIEYLHGWIIL